MQPSGDLFAQRRAANAKALTVFGICDIENHCGHACRRIHEGNGTTVYTVGYERRSADELVCILSDLRVELLLDVRDKPISRKPGFRAAALRDACASAAICYESWPRLGSTPAQREKLRESGDHDRFRREFRTFVKRYRQETLDQLAQVAKSRTIALLCYERWHGHCHRSVLADIVHSKAGTTVIAIC